MFCPLCTQRLRESIKKLTSCDSDFTISKYKCHLCIGQGELRSTERLFPAESWRSVTKLRGKYESINFPWRFSRLLLMGTHEVIEQNVLLRKERSGGKISRVSRNQNIWGLKITAEMCKGFPFKYMFSRSHLFLRVTFQNN